ncbi:MAG: CoA-binding protein [Marinosulfonomonas sp.]
MDNSDAAIREIFKSTKVIACVGASQNAARPSNYVSQYLVSLGYRVIPINPGLAGTELWGEKVYPDLASIPPELAVDFIDIFRRSEAVPDIVNAAVKHLPSVQTIWMQLGVQNAEAAQNAKTAGLGVVQNRCPKIEYPRLFGHQSLAEITAGRANLA